MNRFKEQRIKAGFHSQADLAKVLFVNQTAVSQWERGVTTPSSQLLIKLADLYGVTTDYLLGKEPDQTKKSSTGKGSIKPLRCAYLTALVHYGGYNGSAFLDIF